MPCSPSQLRPFGLHSSPSWRDGSSQSGISFPSDSRFTLFSTPHPLESSETTANPCRVCSQTDLLRGARVFDGCSLRDVMFPHPLDCGVPGAAKSPVFFALD